MIVTAWAHNRSTGALRGDADAIYDALHLLSLAYRWNRADRTYLVRLDRFDDVLAALEAAGHRVSYKAALW